LSLAARIAMAKAAPLLVQRLEQLQERLQAGEEALWPAFCDLLRTLAAVGPAVAPGAAGELLTTEQMADRLGIAPKTLLKHKAAGKIRPAVERGKLLRWSGRESL
jgi:hypothetical protein